MADPSDRSSKRGGPLAAEPRSAAPGNACLDAAVAGVGLTSVFQPIVELPSGSTVGFEALSRWPSLGNPSPQRVFDHATRGGLVDELDRLCITSAISDAISHRLGRSALLAVNCEPASAYLGPADDPVLTRGHQQLQLMFELTERSLLEHPHQLLSKVSALRADGFTVALDDVGAHPDSLALLDIVSPDVVKLDLNLIQCQPTDDQARTLAAVWAHHERTGATILAEGIETDEHLEQALAVGATLGQGFKFGRPEPFASDPPNPWPLPVARPSPRGVTRSAFDIVARGQPPRTARKATLSALSHHIESQAIHASDPPMVLTALQRAEFFTPCTRRRYRRIASTAPLLAIFGEGLASDLGDGIRGVSLEPSDPICAEWVILTLGPHTAAALAAREHPDHTGSDHDRRFDFAITYQRSLVIAAVHNLLDRML